MENENKEKVFGVEDSNTTEETNGQENVEKTEVKETEENTSVSGVDLFLKDYGIEDTIKIEDEEKKFEELSSEEQYNVLKSLSDLGKENLVELDEKEKETIEYLRKNQATLDDVVNEVAKRESDKTKEYYELKSDDFKEMPTDIVYLKHLKEKFPESTDEEIKSKLDSAKEAEGFDDLVDGLREVFETKQQLKIAQLRKETHNKELEKIEGQKKTIVDAVIPIEYISEWIVSDEEKNEILEDIIEVDDNLISNFQKEITSSPEKLFEAAYKYKYMDAKTKQLDTFYKEELRKAYKKGKDEALNGTEVDKKRTDFGVNDKLKIEKENETKEKVFGQE